MNECFAHFFTIQVFWNVWFYPYIMLDKNLAFDQGADCDFFDSCYWNFCVTLFGLEFSWFNFWGFFKFSKNNSILFKFSFGFESRALNWAALKVSRAVLLLVTKGLFSLSVNNRGEHWNTWKRKPLLLDGCWPRAVKQLWTLLQR